MRKNIDTVSDLIVDALGEENIIGEKRCPVITVNRKVIPDALAKKYDLYGFHTGKSSYQFFTYSHEYNDYKKLVIFCTIN